MRNLLVICAFAALVLVPTAAAIERVAGSPVYYSVSSDPITDVNTSAVLVPEVNDRTASTILGFKCANYGEPEVWTSLSSKNPLYDTYNQYMPTVTVRIGSGTPQVIGSHLVLPVVNEYKTNETAIGFEEGISRQMAAGLYRGESVALRVERDPSVGRQTLTYVFPAEGFKAAWNAVNRCEQGGVGLGSNRSVGRASSGEAPKYLQWYFTTCTDTQSGAVRSSLPAGRTHRCQLMIETVPNGAEPVSATFSYELEYLQGGRTQKLTLDGKDFWSAGDSGPVYYRRDGANLVFNLPLNVNKRAERRYNSINVTGEIRFDNGSRKTIYEKLPVTH